MKKYCEELYENQESAFFKTDEREPPPLLSEIAKAMTENGKAAGSGDILAELLKKDGDTTFDELHALCKDIWETGEWPEEWTMLVFIRYRKK